MNNKSINNNQIPNNWGLFKNNVNGISFSHTKLTARPVNYKGNISLDINHKKAGSLQKFGIFVGKKVTSLQNQIKLKLSIEDTREARDKLSGYSKTSKHLYNFVVKEKGEEIAKKLLEEKYFNKSSWTKRDMQELHTKADDLTLEDQIAQRILSIKNQITNATSKEELDDIKVDDFSHPEKDMLEKLKIKQHISIIVNQIKVAYNKEELDKINIDDSSFSEKDKAYLENMKELQRADNRVDEYQFDPNKQPEKGILKKKSDEVPKEKKSVTFDEDKNIRKIVNKNGGKKAGVGGTYTSKKSKFLFNPELTKGAYTSSKEPGIIDEVKYSEASFEKFKRHAEKTIQEIAYMELLLGGEEDIAKISPSRMSPKYQASLVGYAVDGGEEKIFKNEQEKEANRLQHAEAIRQDLENKYQALIDEIKRRQIVPDELVEDMLEDNDNPDLDVVKKFQSIQDPEKYLDDAIEMAKSKMLKSKI